MNEKTIGEMSANIANIRENQAETTKNIARIFDSLEGKNGIMSRLSVVETTQKTIPSVKAIMIQASIWGGFTGGAIVVLKHFAG